MKGSWRIARFANIDVSLHWSFLLLLSWVGFSALAGGGWVAAISELVFVSALFACVVLHEFGHATAAAVFGIPTHGITLLPIGGVAQLDRIPREPWKEMVIALAGPAVNVLIVGLLLPALLICQAWWPAGPAWLSPSGMLYRLVWVNVSLVVFNLIPAFPMDGGRVLRSFLASRTHYLQATRMAKWVGTVVAIGLATVGFIWNPLLILVAAFVAFAADAEYQHVLAEQTGGPAASRIDSPGMSREMPGPVLSGAASLSADSSGRPSTPAPRRSIHTLWVCDGDHVRPHQIMYVHQTTLN